MKNSKRGAATSSLLVFLPKILYNNTQRLIPLHARNVPTVNIASCGDIKYERGLCYSLHPTSLYRYCIVVVVYIYILYSERLHVPECISRERSIVVVRDELYNIIYCYTIHTTDTRKFSLQCFIETE